MPNATYRNRNFIVQKYGAQVAEALDDILQSVNSVALQTTASASGTTPAPPDIGAVSVTAADGIFDVAITDNSPVLRGINYFFEYSADVGFTQPVVIDMGASRNWRGSLGNHTFYFRAYSSYPTSQPSNPVYFGNPTSVVGGGSAGPAPQPSAGSGTASTDGQEGGSGFGKVPIRKQDTFRQ